MTEPQVYGFIPCEDAEFPTDMMVGETVFDCEGKAIGWIVLPELFTEDSKLRDQIKRERQTSRARLESIDMLKVENAKLQTYIAEIETDNAKLRELVRDMYWDLVAEMPESLLEDRLAQMRKLGVDDG